MTVNITLDTPSKLSPRMFPADYYANVHATIESTLSTADGLYDIAVVDEVFEMLKHFLNLDYGRLYVYHLDKRNLVARHGRSLHLDALENGKYSLGEGITGQAFMDQQAIYVKDIGQSSLYKGRSIRPEQLPYRSPAYLAVPFYGDHLCGVLGFHLNDRSQFDVISTMAVVSLVADWLATKSMTFNQQAA